MSSQDTRESRERSRARKYGQRKARAAGPRGGPRQEQRRREPFCDEWTGSEDYEHDPSVEFEELDFNTDD